MVSHNFISFMTLSVLYYSGMIVSDSSECQDSVQNANYRGDMNNCLEALRPAGVRHKCFGTCCCSFTPLLGEIYDNFAVDVTKVMNSDAGCRKGYVANHVDKSIIDWECRKF